VPVRRNEASRGQSLTISFDSFVIRGIDRSGGG
jgi:hypothetical protein